MTTVVLPGTLDTKGIEYGFLREWNRAVGRELIMVNTRVPADPGSEVEFDHAEADTALVPAPREAVDDSVEAVESDTDIDDRAFGRAVAEQLDEQAWVEHRSEDGEDGERRIARGTHP